MFSRLPPFPTLTCLPRSRVSWGRIKKITRVMNPLLFKVVAFTLTLALGMMVLLELGRHFGLRRLARDTQGARAGMGAVEGSVFGLLGLVIAFTFSGAANRFDARRDLIVREANAIGTAWLRLDLLPPAAQPAVRDLMRQYLDSRIETYQVLQDPEGSSRMEAESSRLQQEIWSRTVAAGTDEAAQRSFILVLPALNEAFDLRTTRIMARRMHSPTIVFALLGFLVLTSALMAGFGMAGGRRRSWIHILGFTLILSFAVYVILDLELPRLGLIRIDAMDQVMVDLRQSMN